ncbi:MAG: DUF1016 domain-containing protein [Bacteroidetes bacterium]|nr:DUF1016 domain-containing protein [Bacteroidota bacterium]MCL1969310.1 DUF1016 domain-containing protein [Bacteroidota bacterium]
MQEITIKNFTDAVQAIKSAILKSRYRAAALANRELLSLYYGIGKYISKNSRTGFWVPGAIGTISQKLQQELPGLRGGASTNMKNMRLFFEAWVDIFSVFPNRLLPTDEIQPIESPDNEPDERVLESKIMSNIRKLIMSLGKDFSFIGNQYRLIVEEQEYFIDLLFLNRQLQSLVAFELKKGDFKPEYLRNCPPNTKISCPILKC